MALVNKAPEFDAGDDMEEAVGTDTATQTVSAADRVAAAAAKQAAAVAAAATTAPAVVKPSALAVAKPVMTNPLEGLKDLIPVTYGSLKSIMVTSGNVVLKDGMETLGTHVGLEILSYQDQWVCSPGGDSNDEKSLPYLKFSDDGKTERESGEPLADFVQLAKSNGYENAKIVKRLIVVGALVYPGKDKKGNLMSELENEVVMIDLAPGSVGNFMAYQATSMFKTSRGLITPEQARIVRLEAVPKSKKSKNWTDAEFKTYNPETDYVK
jgi:hypothetical protein